MQCVKFIDISRLKPCCLRRSSALISRIETVRVLSSLNKHDTPGPSDLSEEEVEKKRFKSQLPDEVYRRFIKKEFIPPVTKRDFRRKQLCRRYALFGQESGLDPGIVWPTREELCDIIEHDKLFHPPLREMLDNISAAEQEMTRAKLEYEAEVDKNMAKLPSHMKEYYGKIAKKEKEVEDRRVKQQQQIEEISELLGYDVDPRDPRFQEAVEMKKKEDKKAQKAKKQQESHEKMLARLASMAAVSKKTMSEMESQTKTENQTQGEVPDDQSSIPNSGEVSPSAK